MELTYPALAEACREKGYVFFDRGNYNVNIIGIRSASREPAVFDDTICLAYRVDGEAQVRTFAATTDPSVFYLRYPLNIDGTAILPPGQYRQLWRHGLHKGQYTALVQNRPIMVWRDNNRDELMNAESSSFGNFGINLHRAGRRTVEGSHVDKWSAGCQVIADGDEYAKFMHIIELSRRRYGSLFSYTLFDEGETDA